MILLLILGGLALTCGTVAVLLSATGGRHLMTVDRPRPRPSRR